MRLFISNPKYKDLINQRDPYITANAFNQPLWQAMVRFRSKDVISFVLKAIVEMKDYKYISDFTDSILLTTSDQTVKKYLLIEFKKRGL